MIKSSALVSAYIPRGIYSLEAAIDERAFHLPSLRQKMIFIIAIDDEVVVTISQYPLELNSDTLGAR